MVFFAVTVDGGFDCGIEQFNGKYEQADGYKECNFNDGPTEPKGDRYQDR